MSQQILFKNFELLEPAFGELRGGYELLVEGDTVKELSETPVKAPDATVIDCGKRTLMPGLIDCHVHAIHSEVNVRFMEMLPLTLVTARAATRLRAMLDRGFTTGRGRLGHQDRDRNRTYHRSTALYRRTVDRPDRGAFGFATAHQPGRRMRLLQRPAIQVRDCGRR